MAPVSFAYGAWRKRPSTRLADVAAVVDNGRLHAAVNFAGERIERLQRANAAEIDDGLNQPAGKGAPIQRAGNAALVRRQCNGCKTDVVAVERQEYVVRVIAQRRSKEREIAGDVCKRAADAAICCQDRVSRLARIVAVLRQHLHGATGERGRAGSKDLV
jgi:hypothetical protein